MIYRLALSMSPYSSYHYSRVNLELDRVLVDVDYYSESENVAWNDPDSLIAYMKK